MVTVMKYLILAISISTFVVACAGTNVLSTQPHVYSSTDRFTYEIVNKTAVPEPGMAIFTARLKQDLEQLGLLAEQEQSKKMVITFVNYYMRKDKTRGRVGLMAGVDHIKTNIVVRDAEGNVAGRFEVVSSNPTAVGTSKGLIEGHADRIASYLRTGEPEWNLFE